MSFFSFDAPVYPIPPKLLADTIKHTYTKEVMTSVKAEVKDCLQDAVLLDNHILPIP